MLSCECENFDWDAEWYYTTPEDFSTLKSAQRRRCQSCNKLIDVGSTVVKFNRWRDPNYDVEENIYGDEVPLAPWYYCEECGGLWLTLAELGYCLTIGDNIQDDIRDYRELYNPNWKKEVI